MAHEETLLAVGLVGVGSVWQTAWRLKSRSVPLGKELDMIVIVRAEAPPQEVSENCTRTLKLTTDVAFDRSPLAKKMNDFVEIIRRRCATARQRRFALYSSHATRVETVLFLANVAI